jgi:hypothetical protein
MRFDSIHAGRSMSSSNPLYSKYATFSIRLFCISRFSVGPKIRSSEGGLLFLVGGDFEGLRSVVNLDFTKAS